MFITFMNLRAGYDQKIMYSRTQNDNGSFNTRCLYCFMTVGSAILEEKELEELEQQHVCPEKALVHLMQRNRPAAPVQ